MMNASVLSSVAAFSVFIHASVFSTVFTSSAVSASSTVCAFSAASDSISSAHINPFLFSHTDFLLSLILLEALYIFSSSLLYSPHSSSAPTAFKKMCFHIQVLYDMIHFTSYLLIASFA
ncbi:hypothetical protein I7I50_08664 [Histoplasma capsulatum G186AR]|uniref:Uncharacterized protein n=1 Tax=Ajellomyces capsulatus TaxID=5037 RepID=A0A8H8D0V4_AJECA|nr:hypothetical protein I7I52_06179 [Histoplasma capsulatum]QSS73769.1 hypothetical protein I7I50_08664 [Histoplasma capsulatum G186AR]